jgi:hypothetical protein
MKKHLGSTLGIALGILSILAGLTQTGATLISGIVMLIGALAYRSAKKRMLQEVGNTVLRKAVEGIGIVGIIALIGLQKDLKMLIVADPVPNFVIPVFVVVAYLIAFMRKQKNTGELPE